MKEYVANSFLDYWLVTTSHVFYFFQAVQDRFANANAKFKKISLIHSKLENKLTIFLSCLSKMLFLIQPFVSIEA